MKNLLCYLPLCLLSGLMACNSGNRDPVADAKFENEKRIESQDITDRQKKDADFLVEASVASQLQMELARTAQTKALSPDLRNLAQQLNQQHGEVLSSLRAVAVRKRITLPEGLGQEQQDAYQQLIGKTGAEFDQQYVGFLADRHDDLDDLFDEMAKDAYDDDIRAAAARHAPALKALYERADQLQEALQK